MKLLAVLVAVPLAVSGCELFVDVPNASLANADDAGTGACTASSTCSSPTPVCDTSNGTCVECVTSPDCTVPERAICDADVCRGCRADAECPSSNVCLGDGTCADPARVLYASPTGVISTCTAAMPCTFDAAYAMVSATQDIIKLAAGTYDRPASLTVTKSVIVTGEGATFQDTSAQAVMIMFDVMGAAMTVQNVDFELSNTAAGTTAYAAECTTSGELHFEHVRLANGAAGAYVSSCAFTLDRSTVDHNSIYGFYLVGAQITITSSFITNNGSTQGGVVLATGTTGTIEHVTMSGNTSTTSAHAITCTAPGIVIRSSILYGNGAPSIDPACVVGHSVVDADYTGGANNVSLDPLFVAPATYDYHIQPGSPAIGLADPASTETVDVDGDPRPQPTGSTADSGADEIP
ncbi:MAG: right-handed parallel beta-helix repeat-containing protein [Kofleriaceae bacterium]